MKRSQDILKRVVTKLGDSQSICLTAADLISAQDWRTSPASGRWSAAEVVAHLCQVERGILAYADRVIRKTPLPVPFFRRWHLPLTLVERRLLRRRSPEAVQPSRQLLCGKETMLAVTRHVRERTLAFLEETHHRDLEMFVWRHPFLGNLDFYDWFTFIAAHQSRHTLQLLEIAQNLPKGVASSRK